ncbi:MAG TPA: hypothetical protein PLK37_13040, partial [Terricaulis sp.]|nr:hypothetical protein [Terricaulis sp.]
MSELRPRGLGRGLSALLGEPVRTEPPKPANTWTQPQPQTPPAPQAEAPRPAPAPVEPPRNVFELPVANHQPPQQPPAAPAPQPAPAAPAAPPQAAA